MTSIRIAAWNIDGLLHRKQEVLNLIDINKLDIVLISESHLSDRVSFSLKGYHVYSTNHPDGTSHAGSAIIIRNNIKHYVLPEYRKDHLQATTILIQEKIGELSVSAVYCPPRYNISDKNFDTFFNTLGTRFIVGGDWNAKNTFWGSRTTQTRGRNLKNSIQKCNLGVLTTGKPTHWPTDPKKNPDLIDFFIYKGISDHYMTIEPCDDSASDHTPIIATVSSLIIERTHRNNMYNYKTDWNAFREYASENLDLKIPLKTDDDIELATEIFTKTIQRACWLTTPELPKKTNIYQNVPLEIREKVLEKRRLRRIWHNSRLKTDKTKLNKAAENLKKFLSDIENETLQNRLEQMSCTGRKEHSLWQAVKSSKKPQSAQYPLKIAENTWAKTDTKKAEAFGLYLQDVFTPNLTDDASTEEEIDEYLNSDLQLSPPIKSFSPPEIWKTVRALDLHKAPGFDLITAEVLRELPKKAIVYLTSLFNGMLRTSCFPLLWKVSRIIMVPKHGKDQFLVSSYRPISLLPVLSKLFEKLLLKRLKVVIEDQTLIPDHQFGFRSQHSTIEQVHRIAHKIRQTLEKRQYCSAVFLDVQQAFDRVWHKGLLYKLKKNLPHNFYTLLKSYLKDRIFQVVVNDSHSKFYDIKAGVPQGSVLGPVLYTLFTADLPNTPNVLSATFADDTAALSSDSNPSLASQRLQVHLDNIHQWMTKWRIKASASKSTHVTFTLKKENCPPVKLGRTSIPHNDVAKYLGMHLDRKQTWQIHIKKKRDELNMRFRSLMWLMGRHTKLSLNNKVLLYKTVLKPVWTYGIELWGTASNSNVEILQRFQNAVFRTISNAPWFVKTAEIHDYLEMPTIKEEIAKSSKRYKTRLSKHVNKLAACLTDKSSDVKRLKRLSINDLDIARK